MSGPDRVLLALEQKDNRGRAVGPVNGRRLDPPTVAKLRGLVADVGVGTDAARVYAAKIMMSYLGFGSASNPPAGVRGGRAPDGTALDDWIRRRAWEVLELHQAELPALDWTVHPDKELRS